MPGVEIDSILDLVKSTLVEEPRMKFAETMGQTDYPLVRVFMENAKEKVSSGRGLQWNMRMRTNGSFKAVLLYETTPNNFVNVMEKASAFWMMDEGKLVFDERQEEFNSGQPEELYDHIESQESAMYEDVVSGKDRLIALAPLNANDRRSILGIPYWLPPLTAGLTAPTGGFSGTTATFRDGSTTTLIGGLDASDPLNERHKSYVHTYNGRVDQSFYDALRRCFTRTDFKMLDQLKGKTRRSGGQRNLLAGHDLSDQIEKYANAHDPQGQDPMRLKLDAITIRGVKPIRVPTFDALWPTTLWGTYSKHLYGCVHKTRWMKRRTFTHGENPNIHISQLDSTCQMICDDRQKAGFCLHVPT